MTEWSGSRRDEIRVTAIGRDWDIFPQTGQKERVKGFSLFSCKVLVAILEHRLEGREQEWKKAQSGGFCNLLEGKQWWG